MKKVIIYGIKGFVRIEIEKYLSENYEIVAYSDSFYDKDEFEYKPFINPNNLNNIYFDYIIIATSTKSTTEVVYKKLNDLGINRNKIIEYYYFKLTVTLNPLANYKNMNKDFDGFIFGMSHSEQGFSSNYFRKRFYKFSARSMDLYYQYLLIKYIFKEKNKEFLLDNLKYIVLELPYYIFNFDISKAKDIFIERMNYFEEFNDYHNFGKDVYELRFIEEYKIFKDMFFCKKSRNTSSWSNNHETEQIGYISDETIKCSISEISHVWTKKHDDTIMENIEIFKKILNLINDYNPNIKIIICIFPHSKYEIDYHKYYVMNMKENFYKIINRVNENHKLTIYDHYELFYTNELYFQDLVHMNSLGTKVYSKFLNKIFEKDIFTK